MEQTMDNIFGIITIISSIISGRGLPHAQARSNYLCLQKDNARRPLGPPQLSTSEIGLSETITGRLALA
jgi:hypothetical protein